MDGMKELMLGNQAVAQGLYQAGCRVESKLEYVELERDRDTGLPPRAGAGLI